MLKHGTARKCLSNIASAGLFDDLVQRAMSEHPALMQDYHPVAGDHLVDQVRRPEDTQILLSRESMDVIEYRLSATDVEPDRRFIQ